MGNYDVKWHAYEQAMKNDPAWQKLTKTQKAEQFGRYAQGLQQAEIKAANKANGREIAKALAGERADKIKMYGELFDQADAHYAGRAKVKELSQHLNGSMSVRVNTSNPELDRLNDWYRRSEASTQRVAEFERHLNGNMRVSVNTENPILDGMNDRYRFLEERSDYKRALGKHLKKPTNVTADIIDQRLGIGQDSPQTKFYRALEESQNANKFKLGKWGKIGLIALGAAALIGVGIWAYNKIKGNKEEEKIQEQEQQEVTVVENTEPEVKPGNEVPDETIPGGETPDQTTPDGTIPGGETPDQTTPDNLTPEIPAVVPPIVDNEDKADGADGADGAEKADGADGADGAGAAGKAEDAEDAKEADKAEENKQSITIDGKEYTVKKGDNVWNIAKAYLRDELGREPKLSEIKAKEQQIMKDNELKFEADGYVCIIKPEQKLKVA